MNPKQLFFRRTLWTVALYRLQSAADIFKVVDKTPERFFGATGLRLSRDYHSTTADPFLFTHADRLYLFYEVKTDFGNGEIWAESMGTDGVWKSHGMVLAEDFHISYPNVFAGSDGRIHMVPETAASGKAWLYTAEEFPTKWRRERVLFEQPLSDPSMIFTEDGVLLLGTNRQDQLRAHRAPGLDGEFDARGVLIAEGRATSRSGGAPFVADGKLYRPAQNCAMTYGQNISVMEVDQLSSTLYSERLVVADLYPSRPDWMELGYHHMSIAKFGDYHFLAVDGRRRDRYVNTILLAYFKLLGR